MPLLARAASLSLVATLFACGSGAAPATDAASDALVLDARTTDVSVARDAPATDSPPASDAPCTDGDGDGHLSIACGGDDCDDHDARRFPGNTEICALDASGTARVDPGHDEDCDPTTFANPVTHDGDHDGDGYVDAQCSNTDRNGQSMHGGDCADLASAHGSDAFASVTVEPASIHPTQPEVCNGVDDNCAGGTDEGLALYAYYPDCDGDRFGRDVAATRLCGVPPAAPAVCAGATGATWSTTHDDCDDTRASVAPGATELCDGIRNDCSGTWVPEDVDHDGHIALGASCSGAILPVDDCRDDIAAVHPGQTMFFSHAGCEGDYVPCVLTMAGAHGSSTTRNACIHGTCPAAPCTAPGCPETATGDFTWDYDCNHVDEREPSRAPVCDSGPGRDAPCTGGGAMYSGAPACGAPVSRVVCSNALPPPTGVCTVPPPVASLLGCR